MRSDAAQADWNVRDHVPLQEFIVQAHRGAGVLAPENSLEAFDLAWRMGCVPEADVRTDDQRAIVVAHDEPAGDAPKMSEVFAMMGNDAKRRLYLDIKHVELERLVEEVKSAEVEDRVILCSTNYSLLQRWRALLPGGQTMLWMGGSEQQIDIRFESLRDAGFADLAQVQIHTHVAAGQVNGLLESDVFLIEKGKELRSRGIMYQTLLYGGTTKEMYWKLMDLGFESFATDHPDVTWNAVREYYAECK